MREYSVFLLLLLFSACLPQPISRRADVARALQQDASALGFARALKPQPMQFPRDAGPHPDFQTEWWYYTGQFTTPAGRPFGYQLTFFRRGLRPGNYQGKNPWASHQIWFAHLALSDIQAQRFFAHERWNRGVMGLAGAQAAPYRVWIQDWEVRQTPAGTELRARQAPFALRLLLKPGKPVVLHGKQGLSQKSAQAGNASYYYSHTRLETQGELELEGKTWPVKGLSWLDREWSTSVLTKQQAGWDWFSLQLSDQRELMVFQLRRRDGLVDPVSAGTLVDARGQVTPLRSGDFQLEALQHWRSPHTGVRYPSGWRLTLPREQLKLEIQPRQRDQELQLSFAYWEGAVTVSGPGITGQGYVELTGYTP